MSGGKPYHPCQAGSALFLPSWPGAARGPCPPKGGVGSTATPPSLEDSRRSIPIPGSARPPRSGLAGAGGRSELVCGSRPFARARSQIRDWRRSRGAGADGGSVPTPAVSPPWRGSRAPPLPRCCPCQGVSGAMPFVPEIKEVVPTGNLSLCSPGVPRVSVSPLPGVSVSPLPTSVAVGTRGCPPVPRPHAPSCPPGIWGHPEARTRAGGPACPGVPVPAGDMWQLLPSPHLGVPGSARGRARPCHTPGLGVLSLGAASEQEKNQPQPRVPPEPNPWAALGGSGARPGARGPRGGGVGSARPGAKALGNKEELELGSFPDPAGACPGGRGTHPGPAPLPRRPPDPAGGAARGWGPSGRRGGSEGPT